MLARALEALGHEVDFETPRLHLPVYTLERLAFNRSLRPRPEFDLAVGFDLDGYRIAPGNPPHVAALKGVIADEARFERGVTRLTMEMQARCERAHARRAARVLATSRYSAERAQEFYGLKQLPAIAPEAIDLAEWRRLLEANPAESQRFTVLFVGRLYRRKRVETLIRAAAALRDRIPELEVRIVGDGPQAASIRSLGRELRVDSTIVWLGNASRAALASEYNRAHAFCLPSVQEGFGIVLLEAMAAGKAIVASRAAAIPEVVPHGLLVEPENPEALAAAITSLYCTPDLCTRIGAEGRKRVQEFDAVPVARRFLEATSGDSSATSGSGGARC